MKPTRWIWLLAPALVVAAAACEGDGPTDTPDPGVPESSLTFVRFPEPLQPLITPEDSFYAVAGENRELVLRYQPEEPGEQGEEFLEFRVPGNGLLQRPDGTSFARGDSILIRVRVAEDGRFVFRFEPAGLKFDPEHPARLRVTYRSTNGDLDGDGDQDLDDEHIDATLGMWKQEVPGGLWFRVGAIDFDDFDEIDGEVFGFTGFGIAGRN